MSLLRTEALSKRFGGLEAVRGIDLELPAGEIRAVIGPNGAGKTTLVSVISGRLAPSAGRIFFKERDITGLSAWQRARAGIVYTFQITSVFQNLSCHDNLALAIQRRRMTGLAGRLREDSAALRAEVEAALARVGLAEDIDRRAAELPYGHQRLLEVALGLALSPELLIMDEPTQGLSNAEIARFCALTREIAKEVTVLLIEHNMPVVMELAERITVVERGAILAEGTPAEIRADADVQRAYLGT
ncbi:MAG: ABC transporter ATP-binding protein [Kiloniellales bacterium]|nr:ABC transporter ATP-binding protein [Kiloniellales bacterium]